MQKETKTANELKELLLDSMQKAKLGGDAVIVPNPAYGWSAMAIAAPAIVVDLQARIERLVQELRSRFSSLIFVEENGEGPVRLKKTR